MRLAKRVHTDTRRGAEKVGARGRTHRYETLPRMGTAVVRSLGCMKPVSPVSTVGALLPSSQIYYPAAYFKRIYLSFSWFLRCCGLVSFWEVSGSIALGSIGLRPMPPYLSLLTAIAIPRTGPAWGRGLCPGSRRPRARVPLVVCGPGTLSCGFFAAVSRPPPAASFSLCDLRLFVSKRICLSFEKLSAFSRAPHGSLEDPPSPPVLKGHVSSLAPY